MFSWRLPDHTLQAGTVLDDAAAFDALVEKKDPLKYTSSSDSTKNTDFSSWAVA
jgi:hypothetical protein